MKKRIGSLLLILALCFTLLPTAALAAENTQEPTEPQEPQETQDTETWGDKADTSWYNKDEAVFHIKTAGQLAGIAKLVNEGTVTFEGKTVYLDNDLDLAGIEWISIGTGRGGLNDDKPYCFCGTFDGQGHVISNLYSRDSLLVANEDNVRNLYRTGLFGNVNGGEIRNLGVLDADVSIDSNDVSAAGEAILVDFLVNGKITNCWTTGKIASGSYLEKNIGGIVGVTLRKCTISGCYSTATLTGNFTNSGGYYEDPNPANWPFDTIGGIVGARFDGNLTVTDCWFDGKIVVNSLQAAVGGIVGYTDDQLGSGTVNNCMVTTTDMGVDKDGNTCWVAYALGGTVENCYWPNDEKAYDPSPLEADQGTAVSDFTSADVLAGLKTNAGAGVEWVAGIGHPTFVWDDNNIPADYTAVDAAIASTATLDSSLYTNYSAVEDSINAVDRAKSKAQQTEVNAMAKAIEDAVSTLQYKGADYTKVDAAIAKANALNKDNYKDFTAVEAAVNAVVRDKNITKQDEVDAMAKAIEDAIAALVEKPSSGGGSSSGGGTTGGGSSSSSKPSASTGKTETVTKPDGTKVQTETKADGTKIQTTTGKDGSVTKTETKKDGSSVTENKAADGSTGTVKTDKNGQTEAAAKVSGKAVEDAKKNGEAVKAPVEVEASRNSGTAPTVKVELPQNSGKTEVEIPVSNANAGTVAIIVRPDGTEEILKDSIPTENGIRLTVDGSATVKIVDNAKGFIDTQNHWAKDEIDFVSARELVNGISATRYAPDATATRAQMWTILARQNDADLSGGANWYEKAQLWSKDKGISDGSNPSATITRAQMVTMLWRTMGQPAAGGAANFNDVPANSYYAQAVAWAVEGGITQGVGGDRFDPNGTCTRAQIATFLYRLYLSR